MFKHSPMSTRYQVFWLFCLTIMSNTLTTDFSYIRNLIDLLYLILSLLSLLTAQTTDSQRCTVCLATQILYPVSASLHQVKHILEDLLRQGETTIIFVFSQWTDHNPCTLSKVIKTQVSCVLQSAIITLTHQKASYLQY